MQDRKDIMVKTATWMISRGWKRKLAKKRGREQTLFEHTLVELDVLLELLPILERTQHYGLTDTERKVLEVAVIVHDVGKERDEWQSYVLDPNPHKQWVPHILREMTRAVVPEICRVLGFEELGQPVERIMAHCAEFHHSRPGLSDGSIMCAILAGGSDRFLALAHVIRSIDRSCSAVTAIEAKAALEAEPALRNHVVVSTHEATVRGVSTVFLHSAAQEAFRERGWRVLLYFPDATVYGADPNDRPVEPSVESIRSALKGAIDTAIARDVTPLMVGSPTGNILPKPDLIAFKDSRRYLEAAARKVGPRSFARKPLKIQRRVVEDYWKLAGRAGKPTDPEVKREAERISIAQPEMMVFKFFKSMMDPEKVKAISEDGAAMARTLYEATFGPGSWSALQSTSTLMPAKDMANTVDRFRALPGAVVGCPDVPKQDFTFNAVGERDQRTGQALGSRSVVKPASLFASIVTLKSVTRWELILTVKTILACRSYGAESRIGGNCRNTVFAVVAGWEELITPLELTLELYDRKDDLDAGALSNLIDSKYKSLAGNPGQVKVLTADEVDALVTECAQTPLDRSFLDTAYDHITAYRSAQA
jgi:hypothetical protein